MGKEKLTVLVVEDQRINRQILSALLSRDYTVLEAENGADALDVLARRPETAAILLDIVMPVMDGYEFLTRLKKTPAAALPVIAITADKDDSSEQKALTLGAWDFVSKPYQPATLLTRLNNVIIRSQYYLVSQMKHAYEHDPLTDLYNRTAFFAGTRRLLDEHPDEAFALVRFDIDQFHTYNSFWGEDEGDRLLRFMADWLRRVAVMCGDCVYGRINADVFCICLPYQREKICQGAQRGFAALSDYSREYRLIPSFGVYVIADPHESVQKMYEFASLAAKDRKGNYVEILSWYSPEMSRRVLENQWIVNEMQGALDAGQFEVYLQPKYDLRTERPYGAEALVRWRHPEKGLISPGAFIPVFEQNGFIGKLDYYMWEQACRLLRKWREEGRTMGPISVNVSWMNMYNQNLTGLLTGLVKKYDIPPQLLQLEVTESAYMQNPEVMERVVGELQAAGFVILMDDFGSGYSSLNTLKDIHVDILKIDIKFLSGDSDPVRSRSILASSILMAGWLSTPVIMEGVETAAQVAFLRSIGCNYVQGYFFARPMPVAEYETLTAAGVPLPAEPYSENLENIRDVLWANEPCNELLFNSLEEPAAVYEHTDGHLRVMRVNTAFHTFFGPEYRIDPLLGIERQPCLDEEEARTVAEAFRRTALEKVPSACACLISARGEPARRMRITLRYWGRNEETRIIFVRFFADT